MSHRGNTAWQAAVVRVLHDLPRDHADRVDLDRVVAALAPCDLLESAAGTGWSYVVPHGGATLVDDGTTSTLHHPDRPPAALGSDPFTALDDVLGTLDVDPGASPDGDLPACAGGLVGAFAYDLARRVERLDDHAHADRAQAHLHLRVAEVVVAVPPGRDHALVGARPSPLVGPRPDRLVDGVVARLRAARHHGRRGVIDGPPPEPRPQPQVATTSLSRDAHLRAIRSVLRSIAAGDVFQVNVAQRLTARWPGDTHALYRAMRHQSPAPFGAALPTIGVASVSPETFLAVDGRDVRTRPVKGTRPRASLPALDAAMADDLATSTKDRAENVMVVDLERNDLGRVCRPGSVRAPRLLEVEAHPTVWHLVSTVQGVLRDDVGYGELLRATFPCGSITGAPKVAAMGLIERLEGVRRGWYCGAIGYLGAGSARLSVAIRTATLHADGRADHGSGGGIVADSVPDEEHAETLDKAAAFLRAVAATRVADGRVGPPSPARSVPGRSTAG